MAKFAVLFVAALAFHKLEIYKTIITLQATLARSSAVGESWIRGLLKQVQDNSNDAATSIQNAQVDSNQAKRSLKSQANEWARRIETANFLLQRAINRNEAGEGQEALKQVVNRLDNITHSLRLVLNGEPGELKNKLKSIIPDVAADADKLSEVLRLQLHKEKQNQDNISEDLEDVLEELLGATRQLKLRRNVLVLNQQQIKDVIQKAANDVATALEGISSNDQKVAEELSHQGHELSHVLSRIIHQLRRDAHRIDDEARNTILQVSNKLSEIRAAIDQAANAQGKDAQAWVSEMKNKMKANIHNIEAQLERLSQLLRTGNESSQDAQDINNLVRSILAKSLSGARRLQLRLENINEASK